MSETENFLAHYGVVGMKWGRRKRPAAKVKVRTTATQGRKVTATGGTGQKPSADAVRTAVYKQKAKASTTDALSNRELKALNERLQLEQKYHQLTPATGSDRARKFVAEMILNSGKQNAQNAVNNIVAQQIQSLLNKKK